MSSEDREAISQEEKIHRKEILERLKKECPEEYKMIFDTITCDSITESKQAMELYNNVIKSILANKAPKYLMEK